MRFEWDAAKAAANLIKHQLAFEDAVGVFDDPLHRSQQDRHEDGEERWQTLGVVDGLVLILVAHTSGNDDDDDLCRIISARRATTRERREYERGR